MDKTKRFLSIKLDDMLDWLYENGSDENYIFAHNWGKFDGNFVLPRLFNYCFENNLEILDRPPRKDDNGLYILKTSKNVIMNVILSHNNKTFNLEIQQLL